MFSDQPFDVFEFDCLVAQLVIPLDSHKMNRMIVDQYSVDQQ